ncbi:MAG: HAMP domain-containing histidine kinase [Elusimicrobia bacterium]|nr:HAMP domain-containing histidine kinase [Elusimicrobiota bacterium]
MRTAHKAARRNVPSEDCASYLTHELRAPLASIHAALAILQEQLQDTLTADQERTLSLAAKNTDRLAALINDIMDYSKIRAGKLRFKPEPVAARTVILEATDSLMSWAIAKGVRLLRVPEEEPLPRIQADAGRIVQVLVNLLSNAIKFTPPRGRIEVSARPGRHEHAGTVVFSVKDTGPGVAREDREVIFQRFEQAACGKKFSEGTGLGLTLAKALVELQGGRIWVESWKGLGSTFKFTLPVADSDVLKPVKPYPPRIEYHGLLIQLLRRMNSVLAFFGV